MIKNVTDEKPGMIKKYRDLWCGVILRAILDVKKGRKLEAKIASKGWPEDQTKAGHWQNTIREGGSARYWINSRSKKKFNNFENICYYFNFDRSAVRRAIKE